MQINQPLMKKLLNAIRPFLRTKEERLSYLMRGLGINSPALNRISHWESPVNIFIPHLIDELIKFGEIYPGQLALTALLSVICEDVGEDIKETINDIINEINNITRDNKKYKFLETSGIEILELASEASKAVILVDTPNALGTGFMISYNFLITTNHLISNPELARKSKLMFNYKSKEKEVESICLCDPGYLCGYFYTNKDLDFTIFETQELPYKYTPLRLAMNLVKRKDSLKIIQYYRGISKEIALQNTWAEYTDAKLIQYTRNTSYGSSGSPIFNDNFDVIAIHHSGGNLLEPGTDRRYLRSQGTSAIAILKDLQDNAPEIFYRVYKDS